MHELHQRSTCFPWRARIGILIPQLDCITEVLLPGLLPPGVSMHVSRMPRRGPLTPESLQRMNEDMCPAAELLPLPMIDLVVLHCTTGSVIFGPDAAESLLQTRTGIRSTTTAGSVLRALNHLRVSRISLVTPYNDQLNELEAEFLNKSGFSVLSIGGKQLDDSEMMQAVGAEEVSLWARRSAHADADVVFVSCTSIRSTSFIEQLEDDLEKPVLTSITATLWDVQRKLAITAHDPRCGRLFREWSRGSSPVGSRAEERESAPA
jgi:maleate cis-trans isomerase